MVKTEEGVHSALKMYAMDKVSNTDILFRVFYRENRSKRGKDKGQFQLWIQFLQLFDGLIFLAITITGVFGNTKSIHRYAYKYVYFQQNNFKYSKYNKNKS